jgi:2-polyprenyl-3-methyl-5-hydroxy-6-metoxy-1,4-benzoquinol methylase
MKKLRRSMKCFDRVAIACAGQGIKDLKAGRERQAAGKAAGLPGAAVQVEFGLQPDLAARPDADGDPPPAGFAGRGPAFNGAKNVLDVGAGGGLPGMVLAISRPDMKVSMIDTVHKKTAFPERK